jgi:hypothetical protein
MNMKQLIIGVLLASTAITVDSVEYRKHVDSMTDKDASYVYIPETPCYRRCGSIVVRTGGDVYINTSRYIGDYKYPMEVRFDKGDVKKLNYITSTKGTSLFLRKSDIAEFIKNIKKSDQVLIKTYNYKGTSEIKTYKLSGANLEINKISGF